MLNWDSSHFCSLNLRQTGVIRTNWFSLKGGKDSGKVPMRLREENAYHRQYQVA